MFDKEYSFKGTHAEKVNKLTAKFDDKNQLFKRNLDVYMMAPIVGFLFQKKADVNSGDGTQKPTKIFPQQLIENSDDLAFTYTSSIKGMANDNCRSSKGQWLCKGKNDKNVSKNRDETGLQLFER